MGEKGNYILAVIKTTETYDNLRDSRPSNGNAKLTGNKCK